MAIMFPSSVLLFQNAAAGNPFSYNGAIPAYTIGMWAKPAPSGIGAAFGSNSSGVDDSIMVRSNATSGFWEFVENNSDSSGISVTAGGAQVTGAWSYILVRNDTSGTNRWISTINPDGSITTGHGTAATGMSYAGQDTLRLGDLVFGLTGTDFPFTNGHVAEFWYAMADVQPNGLTTNVDLLRQIAYRGPFSVLSIVPKIYEYMAMIRYTPDNPINLGNNSPLRYSAPIVFSKTSGVVTNTWRNLGTDPTASPHPPLPSNYTRRFGKIPRNLQM